MILIELKKREGCIMSKNRNTYNIEKSSLTSTTLSINPIAFLSLVCANNSKMMRFIDELYYSDEEFYLGALEQNPYRKSRFVTDVKYMLKEKIMRALSVLTVATEDEKIGNAFSDMLKRNYLKIYQCAEMSEDMDDMFLLMAANKVLDIKKNMSETDMYGIVAIAVYFYGNTHDEMVLSPECRVFPFMKEVVRYDISNLYTYSDVVKMELENKPDVQHILDKIVEYDLHDLLSMRCLSNLIFNISGEAESEDGNIKTKKLMGFIQTMCNLSSFDNVPIIMCENEKFSKKELLDIAKIIAISLSKDDIDEEDVRKVFAVGMVIRGFSRMHNKTIDEISSGLKKNRITNTKKVDSLTTELNLINGRYNEQVDINKKKQQALNELQIKYDKEKQKSEELAAELSILKEKYSILESIVNSENKVDQVENKAIDIQKILSKNIVVFGGPPNWHTSIKKVLPNATCIPVSNKSFNTNLIDNSDIIVIKTDYLSHAQWYKIINQARSKNKKVLYCQNNIDMLLSDLTENIKDD